MGLAHTDDAPTRRFDTRAVAGALQDLGTPAGSVAVGLTRWRPEAGRQTTPAHMECQEEEIFFVLAGGGWSWQDGAVCEVRAGDCLVHRVGAEAHTLVGGPDGLDVLSFGERLSAGTVLPRTGIVRLGPVWVEVLDGPRPFELESEVGPVDVSAAGERPPNVVSLDEVEPAIRRRGRTDRVRRDLGRAAGSVRTGLGHLVVAPGAEAAPPHLHTAEEELFVVLAGSGELVLGHCEAEERHPVRAGSVVARPAGSGVAHTFAASPDEELVLLAYGQRDPRDVCWYPRSQKVSLRGAGVIFRVERLDYWDGEE